MAGGVAYHYCTIRSDRPLLFCYSWVFLHFRWSDGSISQQMTITESVMYSWIILNIKYEILRNIHFVTYHQSCKYHLSATDINVGRPENPSPVQVQARPGQSRPRLRVSKLLVFPTALTKHAYTHTYIQHTCSSAVHWSPFSILHLWP